MALIPVPRRKRKVGLKSLKPAQSIYSKFKNSQSYIRRPCL